ncbi:MULTISPECIES: sulfurtransferase TusA family protein [Ureibacillus]|jgi:tRNA 2-thiouridine synthesizing protein A|uniref:Sulfurtransferase TusA family protein n=3 Tax=Ureibacillus TaxID=160795 RepID=A0A540UUW6_9BACL|nr:MULTISPECIES: sulfurtransferase TusA family protein [Ureibacillus]NLY79098.1 sulfurtransferase TusA family protein [Lysinibacillus sp.]MED3662664.1 sulfurtransferase TusA family protein [Ureibacillus terrenus]MED3764488.1 sulfurtransferase TusA family protein [Ureibacillus terrenus]QBK26695.1 sulfurtransferase TusA family protein [Ureibacillus thermophilus]TQE88281.1 sulfurtransferase TusA family protein [Ureibacillus terrenus]
MEVNQVLDAKGLSCPLPIVRAKKAMDTLATGQVLEVHVTDKGALSDFPAWAKSSGHEILDQSIEADVIKFIIKKG